MITVTMENNSLSKLTKVASVIFAVLSVVVLVHVQNVSATGLRMTKNEETEMAKGYPPGHPRLLGAMYEIDPPTVRFTPWADLTTRRRNIAT